MEHLFIYRVRLEYDDFNVIKEFEDHIILKKHDDGLDTKHNVFLKSYLDLILNKVRVVGDGGEKVFESGFIYDDEENFHEERKILLALDLNKMMRSVIDDISGKLDTVKKSLEEVKTW